MSIIRFIFISGISLFVFLTNETFMVQSQNFSELLKMMFYNVDINSVSTDSIINHLHEISADHVVKKKSVSLLDNLDIKKDLLVKKSAHQFKFSKSPIKSVEIDVGYINFDVILSNDGLSKVTNVEWVMRFRNRQKAYTFFEFLEKKFSEVSGFKKAGILEFNSGKFIEFSNRNILDTKSINNITLFFNQPSDSAEYEIKLILYNELSK